VKERKLLSRKGNPNLRVNKKIFNKSMIVDCRIIELDIIPENTVLAMLGKTVEDT
jgi:hypothetical protein